MRVLNFAPRAELAPFVQRFTVVETDGEHATRALLPDTGIVLGIRYRGFARQLDEDETRGLPDATLAGMRTSARLMYTSKHAGIVLASFQPGAASAFFAEPLHELFGKTAALAEILPASALESVAAEVSDGASHQAKIAAIERLLLERLRAGTTDRSIAAAVRTIQRAHGAVRVAELARELGLSRDRFEKRFRQAVGSSPKQLAEIVRMQRAIELYRAGASLTEVALEASYFDQSHFIREFRRFTGKAPSQFLVTAWCT
jgi:AraC-like DNA-binding protein